MKLPVSVGVSTLTRWKMWVRRAIPTVTLALCGMVVLTHLVKFFAWSPDFATPIADTMDRLQSIEKAVARCGQEAGDLADCDSLHCLLDRLCRKGYLVPSERTFQRLESDYWGKPFRWTVGPLGRLRVVKIESAGRDGVFDTDDDLTLEMHIDPVSGIVHSMIK